MTTIPLKADGTPAYYNYERLGPEAKAVRTKEAERSKNAGSRRSAPKPARA